MRMGHCKKLRSKVGRCVYAGNHEIEQQNGVLSNFLVSYESRFKVSS